MREWENIAEDGNIEDAVISYCKEQDWVSFAEIIDVFQKYLKTSGDNFAISSTLDENILFWPNFSIGFGKIILNLIRKEKLFLHSCSPMIYLIDGRVPNLPVVVTPPKKGYRALHWIPVCLRRIPTGKKRLNVKMSC